MPRLRVLAGPSPTSLVPITDTVNSTTPHRISSELFEGQVVVNVKGFTNPNGEVLESEYFGREDRKGITWSIQVQGRFLQPHDANDILFGNTFDRPLKLPWGSSAALKFMKYIDPTLDHDLTSPTKPWALSPLVSTMPHLTHKRVHTSTPSPSASVDSLPDAAADPPPKSSTSAESKLNSDVFPSVHSLEDDTSHLHLTLSTGDFPDSDSDAPSSSSSSSSSLSSTNSSSSSNKSFHSKANFKARKQKRTFTRAKTELMGLKTAAQRRSYFSDVRHRKEITFGPNDVITTDFCYGFMEFSPTLSLRLPGGVSFDLMKYWDGQPVRFVCCERKEGSSGDDPWGRMFWCVSIELGEDIEEAKGEVA